jgi:hypothetical protein
MTFSEVYGALLAEQLKDKLKEEIINLDTEEVIDTIYTDVIFAHNLQYEALQKNPDAIYGIVRGGNATKSTIPNYDSNEELITITIYCKANNIDKLLDAATSLASDDNAVYGEITLNAINYTYRTVFNTPYVIGAPYDLRTSQGTLKAINAVWVMNVNYSSNAILPAPEDKLNIGGTDYDIDFVVRVEKTEVPNYDSSQKVNASVITYRRINTTRTFVYTVRKTNSESLLQSLLNDSIMGVSEITGAITLKVKNGDGYTLIPISSYNINEVWENGVAAITITLVR